MTATFGSSTPVPVDDSHVAYTATLTRRLSGPLGSVGGAITILEPVSRGRLSIDSFRPSVGAVYGLVLEEQVGGIWVVRDYDHHFEGWAREEMDGSWRFRSYEPIGAGAISGLIEELAR